MLPPMPRAFVREVGAKRDLAPRIIQNSARWPGFRVLDAERRPEVQTLVSASRYSL